MTEDEDGKEEDDLKHKDRIKDCFQKKFYLDFRGEDGGIGSEVWLDLRNKVGSAVRVRVSQQWQKTDVRLSLLTWVACRRGKAATRSRSQSILAQIPS